MSKNVTTPELGPTLSSDIVLALEQAIEVSDNLHVIRIARKLLEPANLNRVVTYKTLQQKIMTNLARDTVFRYMQELTELLQEITGRKIEIHAAGSSSSHGFGLIDPLSPYLRSDNLKERIDQALNLEILEL